ncbi:MAG: DMT family transporter [Actinobacteria bacterium]|nr:DMT family transporter [Actinomycetota bacterium]NBO35068.1 DMT family transporter [Actinomycetota bacterium]
MSNHKKAHVKNAKLGYSLYLAAATCWALNGTVSKVVLLEVGDPLRVSQFRGTGTAIILTIFVALTNRKAFRITPKEALLLAGYGIIGVAMCQWFYFESISRMPITISLLIEFMAPIFVVLYARLVMHVPVKNTVWLGLALAVVGLALVAQVWDGFTLDKIGVLFAMASMTTLVFMYLLGDKASQGRDPMSLLMWAFIFASIFFAILRPWGSFPWDSLQAQVTPFEGGTGVYPIWPFFAFMVLIGTLTPYILVINSIRHIGGPGASIMGMTEPPIAAIAAWIVLGEIFVPVQMLGGVIMLVGIVVAERAREQKAHEPLPEYEEVQ